MSVASHSDQSRGNFADFRALRVPYARTHDSIDQATSNGHTVDISALRPKGKNFQGVYAPSLLD